MQTSDYCKKKIKQFEGLRLKAYRDSAGYLTIGYGHRITSRDAQRISEETAESFLEADVRKCEQGIALLNLELNQDQYDALVDFVFNLGIGNLIKSTLLKRIRANAPTDSIRTEFQRWCYAGGRVLEGLWRRRRWESEMWIGKKSD